MTSTTIAKIKEAHPDQGALTCYYVKTVATADSSNTLDLSDYFSQIDMVLGWEAGTNGEILVTESSCILTLDTGGGLTNVAYELLVWGNPKKATS